MHYLKANLSNFYLVYNIITGKIISELIFLSTSYLRCGAPSGVWTLRILPSKTRTHICSRSSSLLSWEHEYSCGFLKLYTWFLLSILLTTDERSRVVSNIPTVFFIALLSETGTGDVRHQMIINWAADWVICIIRLRVWTLKIKK